MKKSGKGMKPAAGDKPMPPWMTKGKGKKGKKK